jgi:hypothetical protein
MPITVGPFCLTHPVDFPCGRKPEYLEGTHDLRQSVGFYSFHMRTGFESHWESSHWDLSLRPQRWKASALTTSPPKPPLFWHCLSQFWNKLLTTCNNLVDIIRLVARLFQQVRCSHDITILLQLCAVTSTLYHFCYIMTVSDLFEQPCYKSAVGLLQLVRFYVYTRKNPTSCNKFVNKPSTSCLRTACHKLSTSLEQAVNNL